MADCRLENDKCCICGLFQAVIVNLAKKFVKYGMLVFHSVIVLGAGGSSSTSEERKLQDFRTLGQPPLGEK